MPAASVAAARKKSPQTGSTIKHLARFMPATHAMGEPQTRQTDDSRRPTRLTLLRSGVGMDDPKRWRTTAPAALQLALVASSALIVSVVRGLVAADTLSDADDIGLTAGAVVAVALGFVAAVRLARPGARRPVAYAAPLALVLIGAVFAARSYADVCVAAESLLHPAQEGADAVIALGPRGDDVRLSGEIRDGAAARLEALLDAHPEARRIHLTSEGGLAAEGAALGDVIAAHGLTTYVPDYCVSACTLAFVAGHERLALRDARLGFHAPFEEGLFGQVFRGDASDVRAAYVAHGLDADFVDEALDVGSDGMWYPEPDRLLAAHVVTAFVDRDRLPDSNLDFDPTPQGARATVLRNFPILAGLDASAPALVDESPAGISRPIATTSPRAVSLRVCMRSATAPSRWRAPVPAMRRWSTWPASSHPPCKGPTRKTAWRSAHTVTWSPRRTSSRATTLPPSRRWPISSAPR